MTAVGTETLAASPWMGLVDMRDHEERWLLGYPAGAVCLRDVESLSSGKLFGALDTTCLVLVCNSGRRARELAERVEAPPGCSLSYLEGGVTAWRDAGLPVVSVDRDGSAPLVGSSDDVLSTMRSCFVAAMIEGAMMAHADLDPIEQFQRALAASEVDPASPEIPALLCFADHLAASHRRLGGRLEQIADNLVAVRHMLQPTDSAIGAIG